MRRNALALGLLALFLSACGKLSFFPEPSPVSLSVPSDRVQVVYPGESLEVQVTLQDTARPAQVSLRLADPCAKGTAYCPGWDASRYPGVAHPTGTYTLDSANPRVDLTFQVDATALPQGPFKYEIQVKDGGGERVDDPLLPEDPGHGGAPRARSPRRLARPGGASRRPGGPRVELAGVAPRQVQDHKRARLPEQHTFSR